MTSIGRAELGEQLSLKDLLKLRSSSDLIFPEKFFPQLSELDPAIQTLIADGNSCNEAQAKPNQSSAVQKLIEWTQFNCGQTVQLPNDFFERPPYLHPLGGSWVLFASHSGNSLFKSPDWMTAHLKWTHLLELSEFTSSNSLTPLERRLVHLLPTQLKSLLAGEDMIKTTHFVFRRQTQNTEIVYSIQSSTVYNFIESKFFIPSLLTLIFALFLIIILLIIRGVRTRQRHHQDKELMMQTIAHELRHPVTSMQLSLEVYRNGFDEMSPSLQSEFLRMTGQLQRLFRMIHASRQYLLSDNPKHQSFSFRAVKIESMREYMDQILADYMDRIQIQWPTEDHNFVSDPYWLSVCVTNLVKNALIHGQPPVKVKYEISTNVLHFEVTDAGSFSGTFKDLAGPFQKGDQSEGLGLGLTIVNRIVALMNGKLTCYSNPTRFHFFVKELSHEPNPPH